MAEYLSREVVLAAQDLKTEDVEVPEWGGTLLVRELTVSEFEHLGFLDVDLLSNFFFLMKLKHQLTNSECVPASEDGLFHLFLIYEGAVGAFEVFHNKLSFSKINHSVLP